MAIVLCIDDHTYRLTQLEALLEAGGYTVMAAGDSESALDLFANNPVDAVVMDCHLLSVRSDDLVAVLKHLRPNLPVVLLSAYCPEPCDRGSQAAACIQKGDSELALLLALAIATRGGGECQSQDRCA
jgi:CheY-like chemotaxis protein